jgi:hypothetical protein
VGTVQFKIYSPLRNLRHVSVLRGAALFSLGVALSLAAGGQSQLVNEENLRDAIVGRRIFAPIELNSLDLNRDGKLDVTDLTYHLFRLTNAVPSVSFLEYTTRVVEGGGEIQIDLVLTKPFPFPMDVSYTISGTATHGPKASGGDFTTGGFQPVTSSGIVTFPADATTATLTLFVTDDAVMEGTEVINLTLSGGSLLTYFLGAQQSHIVYLNDNDGLWTAGLEFSEGAGYLGFEMEIIQDEGEFSGRVLANAGVVPMPDEFDPGRSGEDGWAAQFFSAKNALRIEIGPLPVDSSLSFFKIPYVRRYVLEAAPGVPDYAYDPNKAMGGRAEEVLEPVQSRLGPVSEDLLYLRRESLGRFGLIKHPTSVHVEEVPLQDAK